MLCLFELLFDVFAEMLLNELTTSGVLRHVSFHIVNDSLENDQLVVFLVFLVKVMHFSL